MAIPDSTEIDLCISILNRISPQDLPSLPPDLLESGHRLFSKSVKAKLFGEKDVVAFLKERDDYQFLLRKLTRVHEEVARAHADLVEAAACSGINSIREARAADVNTLGVSALTTEASLLTLIQSISTNIQLPYQTNAENALDSDNISKMLLTNDNENSNEDDLLNKNKIQNTSNEKINKKPVSEKATVNQEHNNVNREQSSKTRKLKGCKSSDDFRVGGHLNRHKGSKATFNVSQIRGLYDDADEEVTDGDNDNEESSKIKIRRRGVIYFVPRTTGDIVRGHKAGNNLEINDKFDIDNDIDKRVNQSQVSMPDESSGSVEKSDTAEISGLGMLSYIMDDGDQIMRACALRTVVEISAALVGFGINVSDKEGVTYSHPCTYIIGKRQQKWAFLGGEIQGLSGETAIAVRLRLDGPAQNSINAIASDIQSNTTCENEDISKGKVIKAKRSFIKVQVLEI
eukprot:CAMPEP_0119048604 /NCGR_PEP_ID=MMETSP1177-20130426/59877_1 /TAXON_ID=2985 /ORGANISM="Ochromonas sp, Strain CCMP1899" /LENGTH=457 /DNA_ID=CAMNT_0007024739 /DNA_START=48 /DNA_END=1422 /DNA_ORIENTATION=-